CLDRVEKCWWKKERPSKFRPINPKLVDENQTPSFGGRETPASGSNPDNPNEIRRRSNGDWANL
ncbi:MAG: hypothetical protein ABIP71_02115, partial [Verrucomicrobiota bacterium]